MAPWLSSGLVYASGLALTAGSVTLLYIVTRTFNFAVASMATIGFYTVYTGVTLFGGLPYQYYPFAFIVGSITGFICYYGLNRPLLRRQAIETTLMMSTLGYDLILLSMIQMYADFLTHTYKIFPRRVTMSLFDFELFGDRAAAFILPVIAIGFLTILHIFLTKTKFGVAMRATIENPILAGASGINSDRVYLVSWIIGGGMAALGGSFMAMAMTGTPVMGMYTIPLMFAGAILGGLGSIYGGILGGLVIGLTEYAGVFLLSQQFGPWVLGYRMGIPLFIMAATLLVFPRGLSGIPLLKIIKNFAEQKRGARA
ncbi:MAG: branched-chain amino acid ABC transporter permease [Firmicutes bacterium]|nr:branched-chain amino acid ABC transporter permease [Bacillota bacterium]